MVQVWKMGWAKAIGVSNYNSTMIEEIVQVGEWVGTGACILCVPRSKFIGVKMRTDNEPSPSAVA
jgi:hypothetical protein